MKQNKTFLKVTASFFLLCFALNVFAHDAWIEPAVGTLFKILYGHKVPEKFDASKVTKVTVKNAAQKNIPYSLIKTKDGMSVKVPKGKPALFLLEFDNGYWIKIGNSSVNVRKSERPEGTDPVHPLKFSKTILSWQPWMKEPQGQRIELVPVDFNGAAKAGSKLHLQLLLDGKPLANQMIENNSSEQGPKTDVDGLVTVTVLKGVNRYATDYDIAQPEVADAQRLSLTAALVFIAR